MNKEDTESIRYKAIKVSRVNVKICLQIRIVVKWMKNNKKTEVKRPILIVYSTYTLTPNTSLLSFISVLHSILLSSYILIGDT